MGSNHLFINYEDRKIWDSQRTRYYSLIFYFLVFDALMKLFRLGTGKASYPVNSRLSNPIYVYLPHLYLNDEILLSVCFGLKETLPLICCILLLAS